MRRCRSRSATMRYERSPPTGFVSAGHDLPDFCTLTRGFLVSNPGYVSTAAIDRIREEEYAHLDEEQGQVCLDYGGMGIFSRSSQEFDFALAYTSASLASHALYEDESSLEGTVRKRILAHMHLDERDYCAVFAADAASAFRILMESFPFNVFHRLLIGYDFENESLNSNKDNARARGAKVGHAALQLPGFAIHEESLRRKLQVKKKHKQEYKGLFAYPSVSRVTGTNNSVQWVEEAQRNGWCVLLDVSGAGANASMAFAGRCFPDFVICSFYKVFGLDPTGFGCLIIKKKMLAKQVLGGCSTTRATGMVKLISVPSEKTPNNCMLPEIQSTPELHLSAPAFLSRENSAPESLEINRFRTGRSPQKVENSVNAKLSCCQHLLCMVGSKSKSEYDQQSEDYSYYSAPCSPCHFVTPSMNLHGLDHVEKLGNQIIKLRQECLLGWLRTALLALRHTSWPDQLHLVHIHSPEDAGPALAFNLVDSTGVSLDPKLVQRLANRNNISLGTGVIQACKTSADYTASSCRGVSVENRCLLVKHEAAIAPPERTHHSLHVLCATVGFLTSFWDVYQLWVFISRFLDAGFCSREILKYQGLNQETVIL